MKKTFTSAALWLLQLCFFLIVPLAIIWLQQNKNIKVEMSHKVPLTVIVLILLVFLVCKKLLLDPMLRKINGKIETCESLAVVTTDPKAIRSLKRELRGYHLVQFIIDLIMPTLLLAIILITIKAVERGLIQLYGALCLCSISFAIGVILKLIAICTAKLEHEEKKKKHKGDSIADGR